MPIKTILDVATTIMLSKEKFSWDCLDQEKFNSTFCQKLPVPLTHEAFQKELDDYIKTISAVLSAAIAMSTLKTSTLICATLEFNNACEAARIKTNQAQKAYQESQTEEHLGHKVV